MSESSKTRLFHLLHQTHQALFRASDKMLGEAFGISTSQSAVLMFLKHTDRATMSEVAQALGLTIASASGLIDRMEKKQLVARQRSESDRRSIQLVLTENGMRVQLMAEPLVKAANSNLIDSLGGDATAEMFGKACRAIIEASDGLSLESAAGISVSQQIANQEIPPERIEK